MAFRIQTSIDKEDVTFRLSGQIDPEGSLELQRQVERTANGHRIVLDLGDIRLVDRYAVKMLAACESRGIELRNCPEYVRDWMSKETNDRKTVRRKRK
jgi:anti-anti-sigma regulatory factor